MTRRSKPKVPKTADEPVAVKRLPRGALISLAVVAVVVAGASVFIWMRTDRPGPALEKWAEATRTGDCEASYEGLSSSAKEAPLIGDQTNWCRIIGSPNFIGKVTADSVLVKGNAACVHATVTSERIESESRVFVMIKERGSWKVDVGGDPTATGIPGCAP
ncbi:MAG: hypothetical protein DCC49_10905 [Acidobacteria bacterium]|nr:MAG: hypothetical protein DCC49_10905 [Acidobacteriota bacterium]